MGGGMEGEAQFPFFGLGQGRSKKTSAKLRIEISTLNLFLVEVLTRFSSWLSKDALSACADNEKSDTRTKAKPYLVNSRRHPKDFSVRVDEHVRLVPNFVVSVGAVDIIKRVTY